MKLKEWADFNVSNKLIDKDLFIEVIGTDSGRKNFREDAFRSTMRIYAASKFFGELEIKGIGTSGSKSVAIITVSVAF